MTDLQQPESEWIEDFPPGFKPLVRGDRTSTMADFVKGAVHPSGVEVLLWEGEENENGVPELEVEGDIVTKRYLLEVLGEDDTISCRVVGNDKVGLFDEAARLAWSELDD